MPGVPKSRGCNNCLKQKKKCDQKKPSCSRCDRLNIECMGSGERKYVFKSVSFTKLKNASLRKLKENKEYREEVSKDTKNEGSTLTDN